MLFRRGDHPAGNHHRRDRPLEEVLRTENKVRTAILKGVDPVDAYLQYRKF